MLDRLGFPSIGSHRRFVSAIAIDAVGSGVFMPVSMLYFLVATPLSLVEVGAAISLAGLMSIPAGPVVGGIVDRIGAKPVLQVSNLMQAVGFAAYLFVDSFVGIVAATMLASVGRTAFFGSYGNTVTAITRPGERELWFGFLGALRNVGFAVGGLASGVAVSIGTPAAYSAVVIVNVASYLVALWLLRAVPNTVPPRTPESTQKGAWGVVLRDGKYRLLVLGQLFYSAAMMVLNFAIPVYAAEVLELPGWVVGAVFTLNTVMVGLGQGIAVRSMTGRRRHRLLLSAHLAFAASFVVLLGASEASVALAVVLVLVGTAVYTFGELVGGPVLVALASEAAPDHLRGRYLSFNQLSWTVTGAAAPVTFAWLLEEGPGVTWVSLTLMSLLGAALTVQLARVMPRARTIVTNRPEETPVAV